MAALTAVNFAQDVCTEVEAQQAVYKQITDNYAGTNDQKKIAISAGKQYVSKYGACADSKAIVEYINKSILPMEDTIKKDEDIKVTQARYSRFDTSLKGKKLADIIVVGKEIVAQEPDFLDVFIVLAGANYDQVIANPTVASYGDDTINYSKSVIEKIEANKTSRTGEYGVLQYRLKNDLYPDGKSNALGSMNYNIGYILHRQGKVKESLPYFYKSMQYNSFSKKDPDVYRRIGAWYLEEAIRLDAQRAAILKGAGNKDTEESLSLLGMQKGYADRAIDGYARAYKLAKANAKPENKGYTDALYTKLKELYAFRYDGKTDGIDAFVATVSSKPMPDPSTEVAPVKETAPATTTTTTTKTSSMTTDTSTSTQPSRPVSSVTTTKTNGTNGVTTKTTTKTTVKKTTPKKKGTR